MGNCQAIDAAALVIQHPSGKIERMYWPISASEVMKTNPGHYVSLIIPLPVPEEENKEKKTVKFTRVKLLRPTDTLALGHAYRLVTTQGTVFALCHELRLLLVGVSVLVVLLKISFRCLLLFVEVMKVLRAKKHAKTKQQQQESAGKSQTVPEKQRSGCEAEGKSDMENTSKVSYICASL